MPSTSEETKRFVVRECDWEWLPDWLVIDTELEVRAGAHNDEESARKHCAELNGEPNEQ